MCVERESERGRESIGSAFFFSSLSIVLKKRPPFAAKARRDSAFLISSGHDVISQLDNRRGGDQCTRVWRKERAQKRKSVPAASPSLRCGKIPRPAFRFARRIESAGASSRSGLCRAPLSTFDKRTTQSRGRARRDSSHARGGASGGEGRHFRKKKKRRGPKKLRVFFRRQKEE